MEYLSLLSAHGLRGITYVMSWRRLWLMICPTQQKIRRCRVDGQNSPKAEVTDDELGQFAAVAMKKLWFISFLFFVGCAAKQRPIAPIRSQMPPPTAELIEHCVVIKQENANTVSCSCLPVTTKIDSKTGHTAIVCKKMKEQK